MQIKVNVLKAVALAASVEQTRYYLMGVYVEPLRDDIRLTATNGHVMICARQDYTDADGLATRPAPRLIPSELIAKLKVNRKSAEYAEVTFDGGMVTIAHDGAVYGAKMIDGTFPNYRHVIPTEAPSGVAGHYDSKYLAALDKAAALLNAERAIVAHNGDDPALINFQSPDVFGVLMPLRASRCPTLTAPPAWVRELEPVAA